MSGPLTPDQLERARQLLAELALALALEPKGFRPTRSTATNLGPQSPRLLSIDDACRVMSLSRWSVYRLIREGRLDTTKIGARRFVPAESIDQFLSSAGTSGGAE